LNGQEREIHEQYYYDTDTWEIEELKSVKFEEGEFFILTAWKGFNEIEDSWEPIESLYQQVPTLLVNFLTKNNHSEALAILK